MGKAKSKAQKEAEAAAAAEQEPTAQAPAAPTTEPADEEHAPREGDSDSTLKVGGEFASRDTGGSEGHEDVFVKPLNRDDRGNTRVAPAPAHADGEPDPSGSYLAGMTARMAAPPAPTRFDGRDYGVAPHPEVAIVTEQDANEDN